VNAATAETYFASNAKNALKRGTKWKEITTARGTCYADWRLKMAQNRFIFLGGFLKGRSLNVGAVPRFSLKD